MYTTEPIEAPLSDEFACDINAFENALMQELDPLVLPMPVSMTKAYASMHDPHEVVASFAARAPDGRVVGTAWMSAPTKDNPHIAFVRMGVAAGHRRSGIGTALLRAYVDFAAQHDRTSLLFGADLFHPSGQAFADSLGATVAMRAHVNQLVLSDLPDGLVQHWIATAHSATGAVHDYELLWVPDNEYPDEWVADLMAVSDVLHNDAPMEDIPVGERQTTADQIRAQGARASAFGREYWTLIAKHRATGEPVGYTEMLFPSEDPKLASQGATAVSGKHRGYALGRWLKATMLERVMAERPEVACIRTFNADSNDPMLAINFAMGFKNLYPACRWLIERQDAETWLEKRT
ncbi:MAG TPA: GNAT family N-acetyltransferase [Acidimicrobiales bacterium]|nr:GNAT family N-acetyltransferase [Acidimicrobiales bacterium]